MVSQEVRIPTDGVVLEGTLTLPFEASGVVAFAHGSGSSRHSPRNRFVASGLQAAGLGTLLLDLLTSEEEAIDIRTRHLRFDIDLLARRMVGAVDWLADEPSTRDLGIGLFGSSTGAAAALIAAAQRPDRIQAVVSRGGRPDLAGRALRHVRAPTLLLVGGLDQVVIELNQAALPLLGDKGQLVVIPGASHLFEEPGALERVVDEARSFFQKWLAPLTTGA